MEDTSNSDLVIRENNWIAAPAVHQKYMDHTQYGKPKRIASYNCAACNATFPDNGLKLIEDGPGVVCRECYVYGRRCKVTGCFEVAMHKEEVCRDHLIFDNWNREDALEEIVYQRTLPIIDEAREPRIKKSKGVNLRKQTSKAMRKMGIPLGPCGGLEAERRLRRKAAEPASEAKARKEMTHG